MKTFKFEYITTLIFLSLLVALAWYYLYLMASNPMSTMMQNKNPMTMSMETMSETEMTMETKSDMEIPSSTMTLNNNNTSLNFLMMPMTGEWTISDFIVMFVMWTIMMFAMMLPSTFIFLNIFRMMRSNMKTSSSIIVEMVVISLTYILIWTVFSLFACTLQYIFHNNGVVDMMGTLQNNIIAGLFLIAAGAFQFTSLKDTCLEKCRNPLSFLMSGPINGYGNVAYVGLKHGLFCLGCCWVLMLLLFVNGVMNLLWVVAITAIVLIEKMLPFEQLSSRFLGLLLVGWGSYLLII
tara:strand:- start:570 stop:1451 length:882 start_codon:yes stop_codon:yes gene_type:complete